ncbi:MAG: prepilin peptidase [Oscillospiraceae bacterium]|nr:prepilin peptidase [Oscillospiraceae bacterium]
MFTDDILKQNYLDTGFYIAAYTLITFLGLTVGSFLNVCICRIPKGESITEKASHCVKCGASIRIYDLIPVLSWFFLRGKCRECGEKISGRYPLVEALNTAAYIILFTWFDINIHSIIMCIASSILICIAFVDIDTLEIDPAALIALAVLGIADAVFAFFFPEFMLSGLLTIPDRLIGAVCISVPFFVIGEIFALITKKITGEKVRGIELGDTFLMAASGLLIGWQATVVAAFMGIILASIGGIISKLRTGESKIPFGPYLAAGIFLAAMFGQVITNWYLTLLAPKQ